MQNLPSKQFDFLAEVASANPSNPHSDPQHQRENDKHWMALPSHYVSVSSTKSHHRDELLPG